VFKNTIKTLPSGGHPTLVTVNVGLWELRRYDQLLKNKRLPNPMPPIIDKDYVAGFRNHTYNFLRGIRTLVGEDSRIRWRQMHTPFTFINATRAAELRELYEQKYHEIDGNQREWLHAAKVKQLNEAARQVAAEVSKYETERRILDGIVGVDTGRIDIWPIGDIVSAYPSQKILKDIVHPNDTYSARIWGEGILEQLSRTPTVRL
jgi:hypothetical protein